MNEDLVAIPVIFGTISWIDPRFLPDVGAALVANTTVNAWMVKTVMGLAATANYEMRDPKPVHCQAAQEGGRNKTPFGKRRPITPLQPATHYLWNRRRLRNAKANDSVVRA